MELLKNLFFFKDSGQRAHKEKLKMTSGSNERTSTKNGELQQGNQQENLQQWDGSRRRKLDHYHEKHAHETRPTISDGACTHVNDSDHRDTAEARPYPTDTGEHHTANKQQELPTSPHSPSRNDNGNIPSKRSYRDAVSNGRCNHLNDVSHSSQQQSSYDKSCSKIERTSAVCTEAEPIAYLKKSIEHHRNLHAEAKEELVKVTNEFKDFKAKANAKVKELQQEVRQTQGKAHSAQKYYENNLAGAEQQIHNLEARTNQLQRDNIQLQTVHVKSVNVVSPGVEQISDQEFVSRLIDIHDRVGEFFRAEFKKKKLIDLDEQRLTELGFLERIYQGIKGLGIYKISVGNLMCMVFWSCMEDVCETRWLPGLDSDGQSSGLTELEKKMEASDSTETKQRVEFWRHYTSCLLSQDSNWIINLNRESHEISHWLFQSVFPSFLGPLSDLDTNSTLIGLVRDVLVLWKDLRCQRAYYAFDFATKVGDAWDPKEMDDFKGTADDVEEGKEWAFVTVVIARGIFKMETRGMKDEEAKLLMKPRVLLETFNIHRD